MAGDRTPKDLWNVKSEFSDDEIARRVELRHRGFDEDLRTIGPTLDRTRHAAMWASHGKWPDFDAEDRDNGTLDRFAACLPELISPAAIEWVAISLTTRVAVAQAPLLLATFPTVDDHTARWHLGSAFEKMAGPALAPLIPQVLELIHRREFGLSRQVLGQALPRIRTLEATAAAIDLVGNDPDVDGFILSGLRLSKAKVPEAKLRLMEDDDRAWVCDEVIRLRRIRDGR